MIQRRQGARTVTHGRHGFGKNQSHSIGLPLARGKGIFRVLTSLGKITLAQAGIRQKPLRLPR
ncbi:MAG: hypothetical protein WBD39_04025 [Candidatus Acidiferrales bacterium]